MALQITSGQTVTATSDGAANGATVFAGGTLDVPVGLFVDSVKVSGGTENLFGSDGGAVVSGNFTAIGFQHVFSGGVAFGTTLADLALQQVDSGAQASNTHLFGKLDANDNGGDLSRQIVEAGGVATDALLTSGGLQTIFGTAYGTQGGDRGNSVEDLGTLAYVSAQNYVLSAGIVGFGDIVVSSGAHVLVSDANANYLFEAPYYGAAFIGPDATLELGTTTALHSGTIVFENQRPGTLQIDGTDSPTETIANFVSGNKIVINGLHISGAQVSDGLVQLFTTTGGEDDIRIADGHDGGIGIFSNAGNVTLSSYFVPTYFEDGDVFDDQESDFIVGPNGTVTVGSGGTAVNGALSVGTLAVGSGGTASGTFIGSGGTEAVRAGGTSVSGHVQYGGSQAVDQGGVSIDPVVAGGSLMDNGAVQFDAAGTGSARVNGLSGTGTVRVSGGAVSLQGSAGGFTGSVVVQAGGTVSIGDQVGLDNASLVFDGGTQDPTIVIDTSLGNLPHAVISGFSTADDVIDLRRLSAGNTVKTPFSAYVQAVVSGGTLLEVVSGGNTYSLNLDSGTAGSGPLNLVADGSGGTAISFSTLSAGTAAALNAAVASAATLGSGTYTVFLTSGITLTTDNGQTPSPDPIQALNGGTVVLNGEGFAITPGNGGIALLVADAGPVVVTQLAGPISVQVDSGAHLTLTSNTYDGSSIILSGTLEVADSAGAGTGGIAFVTGGGSELLQVDAAALAADGTFGTVVSDFGGGAAEYLDLAGFAFVSGQTSASLLSAGTMLSVTNGATRALFMLDGMVADTYHLFDDANGGTIVTADSVACFVTGTMIQTELGERPVETLAIGDGVVTVSGAVRPVRWVGWRSYHGRFLAGRPALWPVCVRAGALDDGVPTRDLLVSPLHALLIDGVLVPARALVNGSSVVTVPGLAEIGYWHVELDDHDALFANGAPAETFVDDGSRGLFANAAGMPMAAGEARYCAPRVEQGAVLGAIRARLAHRAAGALAA